jgi:hypothetical protein
LFKSGGNYHEYAHFGWGDLNLQLYGYIEGYKEAADSLIEEAIESQSVKKIDTYVFPICFLYRHYLELMLKTLFLKYSKKNHDEKKKLINNAKHNLDKIWKEVKFVLVECSTDEEMEDVENAERYIKQIHEYDKDSFSFRYPMKLSLEKIHKNWQYLDLRNLKEGISELYKFLNYVDLNLGSKREAELEMLSLISEVGESF